MTTGCQHRLVQPVTTDYALESKIPILWDDLLFQELAIKVSVSNLKYNGSNLDQD
jgi:hypothetical protein